MEILDRIVRQFAAQNPEKAEELLYVGSLRTLEKSEDLGSDLVQKVRGEALRAARCEEASVLCKACGVTAEENAESPVWFSIKKRMPWLLINLATAFLAASIVGLYEHVIAALTILAIFLPVIAGQAGNSGAQTLAIIIRSIASGTIDTMNLFRLVLKQTVVTGAIGLIVGVIAGGVGYLWHGNVMLSVVITVSMIVNMAISGCVGSLIPILLYRAGQDPAQASSIIYTTITDSAGFFLLLGLASFCI